MNCIENFVGVDDFRIVHLPGPKQEIFHNTVSTLPFLFYILGKTARLCDSRSQSYGALNFVRFFWNTQRWNRVSGPQVNGSAILAGLGRVTGQCVRPAV